MARYLYVYIPKRRRKKRTCSGLCFLELLYGCAIQVGLIRGEDYSSTIIMLVVSLGSNEIVVSWVGHHTSTRRGQARRRGEGEGDAARRDHATDGGRLSCSPPTLPPFSGRLPPPHASPPPPHPSSNPIHKTHRQSITKTRGPLLGARQTRNGSPLRLSPVLLPRPKIRSIFEDSPGRTTDI